MTLKEIVMIRYIQYAIGFLMILAQGDEVED